MTYEVISPKDALKMIEDGDAVLIDVREADEFTDMHIPYAMSLPMSLIDGMFHHLTVPNDTAIIFQCKMGGRSARVCEYVTQTIKPLNTVYNMDGGILAWKDAGLIIV
jgi:rhodanese-related sulfurtransferase